MKSNYWQNLREKIWLIVLFSTNWLPHLISLSFIGVAFYLSFTRLYFITLAYLVWYIYDYKSPQQGGHFCGPLRRFRLWKMLEDYYPAKLHKMTELDPNGNYMFAMHPHGHFMCLTGNGEWFHETYPGLTVHGLTVDGFFKWPFLREWLLALGCGSVSAESIEYKLTKLGPGHSVAIAIGGREEMYWANTGQYHLRISKRKGFIRLALKTKVPIVPVFLYGVIDGYDLAPPDESKLAVWMSRLCDIPNVVGRFGNMFVPKQMPINIVVGKPITFDREALERIHGTAIVDACHKIYFDELRKLFEENKARFNDERQLIYV